MSLNDAQKLDSGNIRTPRGKISFPALITPRANPSKPNDPPKYQVTLLIPPTANIEVMQTEAAAAARAKWGDTLPPNLRSPFLKAEELVGEKGRTYGDEFNGWTVIRLWSKMKPDLVDGSGQRVDEEREIYAGRWARISVRPYAYSKDGNRGVSFGLQNVQLLENDTPIAGARARAEDEFETVTPSGDTGSASAGSVFGDSAPAPAGANPFA